MGDKRGMDVGDALTDNVLDAFKKPKGYTLTVYGLYPRDTVSVIHTETFPANGLPEANERAAHFAGFWGPVKVETRYHQRAEHTVYATVSSIVVTSIW